MKSINDSMSEHASITLADGTVIGAQQRKIRFPDVSGPIYRMIKAVVSKTYIVEILLYDALMQNFLISS